MMAAQNGHLAVTQCLLEHGVDVDKARDDGWTPLHIACHEGHVEVLICLMNWGASLTIRTHDEDDLAAAAAGGGDGDGDDNDGNNGELPIDVTDNETIKQLHRAEEKRRRNHGFKRGVLPNPTAAEELEMKRQRLELGVEEEEVDEQQSQVRIPVHSQVSTGATAEGEDREVVHSEMSSQPWLEQLGKANNHAMTMMNSTIGSTGAENEKVEDEEEEEEDEEEDDDSESSDEEYE